MGRYIQGPTQGKAQYILSEYGGKRVSLEEIIAGNLTEFELEGGDGVIICVVENRTFDAAALIENDEEFIRWAYDQRPRTWLIVPDKVLEKFNANI